MSSISRDLTPTAPQDHIDKGIEVYHRLIHSGRFLEAAGPRCRCSSAPARRLVRNSVSFVKITSVLVATFLAGRVTVCGCIKPRGNSDVARSISYRTTVAGWLAPSWKTWAPHGRRNQHTAPCWPKESSYHN
jgi:hypothetical protein